MKPRNNEHVFILRKRPVLNFSTLVKTRDATPKSPKNVPRSCFHYMPVLPPECVTLILGYCLPFNTKYDRESMQRVSRQFNVLLKVAEHADAVRLSTTVYADCAIVAAPPADWEIEEGLRYTYIPRLQRLDRTARSLSPKPDSKMYSVLRTSLLLIHSLQRIGGQDADQAKIHCDRLPADTAILLRASTIEMTNRILQTRLHDAMDCACWIWDVDMEDSLVYRAVEEFLLMHKLERTSRRLQNVLKKLRPWWAGWGAVPFGFSLVCDILGDPELSNEIPLTGVSQALSERLDRVEDELGGRFRGTELEEEALKVMSSATVVELLREATGAVMGGRTGLQINMDV